MGCERVEGPRDKGVNWCSWLGGLGVTPNGEHEKSKAVTHMLTPKQNQTCGIEKGILDVQK